MTKIVVGVGGFKDFISFESTVEDRTPLFRMNCTAQLGRVLSRGLHNAWLSPVDPEYGVGAGRGRRDGDGPHREDLSE